MAICGLIVGRVRIVRGNRTGFGVDRERVISLVESIENRLPICIQLDSLMEDRMRPFELERRQDLVERRQVLREWSGIGIHVDPDESSPGVKAALHQMQA